MICSQFLRSFFAVLSADHLYTPQNRVKSKQRVIYSAILEGILRERKKTKNELITKTT